MFISRLRNSLIDFYFLQDNRASARMQSHSPGQRASGLPRPAAMPSKGKVSHCLFFVFLVYLKEFDICKRFSVKSVVNF